MEWVRLTQDRMIYKVTDMIGREVITRLSYLRGPGFESGPERWLSHF